jgi:tryptophanyl-tRNA synthetase
MPTRSPQDPQGAHRPRAAARQLDALAGRPEARNLVNIYAALAGKTPEKVVADFAGQPFAEFKPALADLAVAHLAPITARMNALMADPAEIDRILGRGRAGGGDRRRRRSSCSSRPNPPRTPPR